MHWKTAPLCLLVLASPAAAETVTFTGTVTSVCSITAVADGTLVLNMAGDALTSEPASGGTPGSVTISAVGTNRIDVGAPLLTVSPGGYVATGQILEVAYSGMDGGTPISQAFTTAATSITPASLSAAAITLNNRIRNAGGFAAGNYETRTVVTCVPLP